MNIFLHGINDTWVQVVSMTGGKFVWDFFNLIASVPGAQGTFECRDRVRNEGNGGRRAPTLTSYAETVKVSTGEAEQSLRDNTRSFIFQHIFCCL